MIYRHYINSIESWEEFPYHLGEFYQYPNCRNIFKLVKVDGFKFLFECGHWCTDSVFQDLIIVKTGIQVYKDNQLEISFYE